MMKDQEDVALPARLTVRETTPDQVPPLPDPLKARRYLDTEGRYAEGGIHAGAGKYQQLVLHVRTGEFYFHCDDWRVARNPAEEHFPPSEGLWAPFHWLKVPDVIWWVIDAHFHIAERPFLTLDEGNAFARKVAPLAQTLLENLRPVPGTDSYDWSPEAASAGMDIKAACSRHQHPPKGCRPELVDMAEAVSAYPELTSARWVTLDDKQLDREAEHLNRSGLSHNRAIVEALGIAPDARDASLVGTRAWLYVHRAQAAEGRRMLSAADWLATHPVHVTADTTDTELEAMPAKAHAAAAAEGVVLVGDAKTAAHERRTRLRQEVLDELAAYGEARAAAEKQVKASRAAVYARLYRAFAWESQHGLDLSDAALGRLARMTRQAVNKLHEPPGEAGTDEEIARA
ncbi:hypothetical protein ACFV2X_42895 [Streptomyces sp. NPDC059679]|uniref:hypothetical protein n=1 Tax=Streptomyces sp. NPDC059679 TaxID=3346903 RepID=UPI0036C57D15